MVICKTCGKEVDIDPVVFANCDTYNNINLAISKCCGMAYIVKPITTYQITEYTGDRKEDDWGNEIKS